jgi:hypothetical protein
LARSGTNIYRLKLRDHGSWDAPIDDDEASKFQLRTPPEWMVRRGAMKPSSLAAPGASLNLKRSRLAGVSATEDPDSDGDSGSGGNSDDDKGFGIDK